MVTPSATLLTAPMFGLKLVWTAGALVLLLTRQCRLLEVARRLCAYLAPAITSCCATAERSTR
jgi:hypothetical protein